MSETIILTEEESRKRWLAERRRYVCSSDAAAILGVRLFAKSRSILDVYLEKTSEEDIPELESDEIHWGNIMEDVIAKEFARRENVELTIPTPRLTLSDSIPWAAASIDRFLGSQKDRILECKNTGFRFADLWGPPGTDFVPEPHIIQVNHQMACTGIQIAEIAVLIGGNDFRTFTIPRNESLIQLMLEREEKFWNMVRNRTPPAPEWGWDNEYTLKALRKIHRPSAGKAVSLGEDAVKLAIGLEGARDAAADMKRVDTECKSKLVFLMGDAEEAKLPNGWTVQRKIITKNFREKPAYQATEEHMTVVVPRLPGEKKKKRGSQSEIAEKQE